MRVQILFTSQSTLQVMMMVVMQSSDIVKLALAEGSVLKIFGDWLLTAADATHPGRLDQAQKSSSNSSDVTL